MKKLVVHLHDEDSAALSAALGYLNNFSEAAGEESYSVVLLANGPAVKFFVNTGTWHNEIAAAAARKEAVIQLCHHALARFQIDEEELVDGCVVVPFGIMALVGLQERGFAYVKA